MPFLICFFLGFTSSISSIAQNPPSATINPDPSSNLCPSPNFREFTWSISNISSSEVELTTITNLTVSNTSVNSSNNTFSARLTFSDQSSSVASVQLRVKNFGNGTLNNYLIATYTFPNVQSVFNRHVFRTAPNSITVTAPLCPTNVSISFPRIKYVRLGGREDVPADLFGDVIGYQYLLPSGVLPVSGLTPAPGLPNTYNGSENVIVSLTHAFNNATIKVRALNSSCSQAVSGIYDDIIIQRNTLSVSGPATIRCGETDTKTFTVQGVPASPNCIESYTWQIANKGWKYNGSIPTIDVVTTTPSIQLVSADNNAAPPQSVSVLITANNNTNTVRTRTVNYLAPTIALTTIGTDGFDCNSLKFTSAVTNAPLTNFSYLWTTPSLTATIDYLPSPVSTTVNTAILGRDPNTIDPVSITGSIVASCGTIASPIYPGFSGCVDWSSYVVYSFADPLNGGGNIVASIEGLPDAIEYTWYAYYLGSYHLIGTTSNGYLQANPYTPCVDEVGILVRAQTYGGYTELKYVGSYMPCNSNRMAATKPSIKVYPNPASTVISIMLDEEKQLKTNIAKTKAKNATTISPIIETKKGLNSNIKNEATKQKKALTQITQVKVINNLGMVFKLQNFAKGSKSVNINVADLKEGIYMLEVSDGQMSNRISIIIKR